MEAIWRIAKESGLNELHLSVERSFEFENETADVYVIILVASSNGDITGMVNGWMVKDGYATVLTIEPNTKYAEQFEFYQKTAKDAGRGLWEYEEFAKNH